MFTTMHIWLEHLLRLTISDYPGVRDKSERLLAQVEQFCIKNPNVADGALSKFFANEAVEFCQKVAELKCNGNQIPRNYPD